MDGPDTERPDFEGDPMAFASAFADPSEGSAILHPEEQDEAPTEPHADYDEDMVTLLAHGRLHTAFEFLGHQFVMQSLKSGEEIAVTSIVKPYMGTLGEAKAYGMATVAASLVTVDGAPLTRPLGPGEKNVTGALAMTFHYIGTNWDWPVVDALYDYYSGLVLRQNEALQKLRGKAPAGRRTS